MCLAFLVFGSSPPQPLLLLAFNRDEFFERPTKPLHIWDDGSGVLAGRDLDSGGTWLGVNASTSRVAFLTNLRSRDPIEPATRTRTHSSRGELPTGFLSGDTSPQEFAQSLQPDQYHGFNLVVGDLRGDPGVGAFAYTNNALDDDTAELGRDRGSEDHASAGPGGSSQLRSHPRVQLLEPGRVYGLSNGVLMEWPKVTSGVQLLQGLLPDISADGPDRLPWDRVFNELLGDTRRLVAPASTAPIDTSASQSCPRGVDAVCEGHGAATAPSGADSVGQPPAGRPGVSRDEALRQQRHLRGAEAAGQASVAGTAEASSGAAAVLADGGCGGSRQVEVVDSARFQEDLEHITSGRYVEAVMSPYGMYGTRSQTVIVVWHDGSAEARERHRGDDGGWRESVVPFRMELRGADPAGGREGPPHGKEAD